MTKRERVDKVCALVCFQFVLRILADGLIPPAGGALTLLRHSHSSHHDFEKTHLSKQEVVPSCCFSSIKPANLDSNWEFFQEASDDVTAASSKCFNQKGSLWMIFFI